MTRQLIISDCESSGLRAVDIAVEVAWLNVDTGEARCFVPRHDVAWVLANAEPRALEINGYRDRIACAPQDDGTEVHALHEALMGNAMAGSNPRADAGWLAKLFAAYDLAPEPCHYRLPDLASYAAGALGIDPRELPGLWSVCELLGVEQRDHTAAGDVRATAECFRILEARAQERAA